jgi:single-strand DNA-binding protein
MQVSGVCRLGADPELRFTPSGAAVCSARAIFQDRYQDRQTGEWKDGDATWATLIGWRQLAENMAESFKKGDDVMVTGTLVVREYETREGGKGHATEVKVREIGPSIRFHAAKSARVDRQYDGPAAGPVEDPWGEPHDSRNRNQPPQNQGYGRNAPQGEQRREAGRWIGSGEQVARPQSHGYDPVTGSQYPDEPPFFHRTPGYQP